jgi:uncharacterized protein
LGREFYEVMTVDELDGFLAGVLICPDMIPPSRWMPYIWSETGATGDAPVFEDIKEAERVTGLILEHYNSAAASLMPDSGPYEPVFSIDTRNDDVLWELWTEGFRRAMAITPGSWLAIAESGDGEAIEALAGMRSLIAIDGGESDLPEPEQDRLIIEAPDLIAEWVEILSFWRLANDPIAPVSANTSFRNIGRNDPCPCGSGKKYKKCHGAN